MAFLVGGANSASGDFEISNSCRFKATDNPELSFTPGSAVIAERQTFTISCWVKLGILGTVRYIWEMGGADNANDRLFLRFLANNTLSLIDSGTVFRNTTRVFRDISAWYHLVVAVDTTDGTAGDRIKIYVNGVQETSFGTTNNPSQNDQKGFSDDSEHNIGRSGVDDTLSFDGYIAEFHAVGASQLAATSFGETNDNGVWIPKKYSGSYGTNGFKLEFKQTGTDANASGIGADTSGNGNHFVVVGDLNSRDITTDTPQNNFATLNPLDVRQGGTFVDGNCQVTTDSSNRNYAISTIGVSNGKWYCEAKISDGVANAWLGVADFDDLLVSSSSTLGDNSNEIGLQYEGTYQKNNSNTTGWSASFAEADIMGVLLDLDNNRITYHKNGSYSDGSGNFDESSPTAYISFTNSTMGFAFGDGAGAGISTYRVNFGNSLDTISSGNADANGYGNFEYAVPSGFYALCTKNLAEFG